MKIRAELHLGEHSGKVMLAARPEEKADHLALKLAAYAMFLRFNPIVDLSADHPALQGLDLRPDVCAMNEAGELSHWIECGEVSINKLDKVTRRFSEARVVVVKSMLRQANNLRELLTAQIKHGARIEIWAFPNNDFNTWLSAMMDRTEIFGEAHEKSFNLVVNNVPYVVDLIEV